MLIPAIDLKDGRVVQLVRGETLALAFDDLDAWIARFRRFPLVHVIDLDAALGSGRNDALVRRVAAALPVRAGGGVRTVARALELLDAGARAVIVGSSLFREAPARPGSEAAADWIDTEFATRLAAAVGVDRIVGAVDAKGGRVAIHGWRTVLPISPADAVRALEPYCGGYLYTHVDREGSMQGTDLAAIRTVAGATRRRLTAAGGIATRAEIDALDALGIDAVVGMAVYTGVIALDD